MCLKKCYLGEFIFITPFKILAENLRILMLAYSDMILLRYIAKSSLHDLK